MKAERNGKGIYG